MPNEREERSENMRKRQRTKKVRVNIRKEREH